MRLPGVLWVRLVFSLATPSPCTDAISCASNAHRPPLSAIPVSLFTPPPPPDRCLAVIREPHSWSRTHSPYAALNTSQRFPEPGDECTLHPPTMPYSSLLKSFLAPLSFTLCPWTDALCLRTVPHLTVMISLPGNRKFLHHSLWDRHLE